MCAKLSAANADCGDSTTMSTFSERSAEEQGSEFSIKVSLKPSGKGSAFSHAVRTSKTDLAFDKVPVNQFRLALIRAFDRSRALPRGLEVKSLATIDHDDTALVTDRTSGPFQTQPSSRDLTEEALRRDVEAVRTAVKSTEDQEESVPILGAVNVSGMDFQSDGGTTFQVRAKVTPAKKPVRYF